MKKSPNVVINIRTYVTPMMVDAIVRELEWLFAEVSPLLDCFLW